MEAATNTANLRSGSETVEMNTSTSTAAGVPLGFLQRPVVINLLSFSSTHFDLHQIYMEIYRYNSDKVNVTTTKKAKPRRRALAQP